MGQESSFPKAAQKFSQSLLHHPEDDPGSEEPKKDFKGMGLEGKADVSLALAWFLRLNAGRSNTKRGNDRLVLFLHSHLCLCFLTWYARTLWECVLLHPCLRHRVIKI